MNVIHEPGVRKAALMKNHQSGGSEALNNIIGYCMQHDPCPMLVVHPTAASFEAYSKERLADMIHSTPALRQIVTDKRVPGLDGLPESTLSLKMFPAGFLAGGGANTPNTFARWSVRLAIADDFDRFPPTVGDEGDPGDLLVNRTTTYHDRLAIFVSTPTLKGGRIDSLLERSDQRRFFCLCPRCGRRDYIRWNDENHFRVVFDDRDPSTARIECPDVEHGGCGYQIREPERAAFTASGIDLGHDGWDATAEAQEPGLVGWYNPFALSPWVSLQELVEKFLVARKSGREAFKTFVNTMLGEAWDDRTSRMEANALMVRVEDYGTLADGTAIEVPAPAAALTAGVDVQASGFLLSVYGWGPAGERWLVDHRTVPGDPRKGETHGALIEALSRHYQHASGLSLPIHSTCIDSGYASDDVYSFVLKYQARRIYATKGDAGKIGQPLIWQVAAPMHGQTTTKTRTAASRAKKIIRPVALYHVNVDDGKSQVMASLSLAAPGPNFIHFPAGVESVDSEFFAQLCAEHKETRYNKGGVAVSTVWVQDREANHALDEAVLAMVALRILRPNMVDMAARIRAVQTAEPSPPALPTPAPVEQITPAADSVAAQPVAPVPAPLPRPRPAARRMWRSAYLGG